MKKPFTILFLLATISAFSQTIKFNRTYDFGSTADPIFTHLNELGNNIYVNGIIKTVNQKILF
ncbi:MAG: hypothetical protein ABIJ97_01330, partial [Bacteroidota bacterium]